MGVARCRFGIRWDGRVRLLLARTTDWGARDGMLTTERPPITSAVCSVDTMIRGKETAELSFAPFSAVTA